MTARTRPRGSIKTDEEIEQGAATWLKTALHALNVAHRMLAFRIDSGGAAQASVAIAIAEVEGAQADIEPEVTQ